MGVEYNPDMVAFAQKNLQAAGVTGKAQIVHGDIFATDFTQALVASSKIRMRGSVTRARAIAMR